jgi:hypothetical protein
MADKRISQLIERTDIANNDVLPIVASGATTTNKVTISTIQDWMQDNLDVGVTSVGITFGTSGTDINASGSPVTSSGNITINLPTASATNRGALSSADWITFNAKQPAGNYVTLDTAQTITAQKTFTTSGSSDTMIISHGSGSGFALDVIKAGSGEAIRVTKTSGSGNAMSITGGNFSAEAATFSGIVTTTPDAVINSINIGKGAGNVVSNTRVGLSALQANTTGNQNTAVGNQVLNANTSAAFNTGIGYNALLKTTTGSGNTAVGAQALVENTTGPQNTAVGVFALQVNTTASANTAIGWSSLYSNTTGTNNTGLGSQSLHQNTTGINNTAAGRIALRDNTTGSQNAAFGNLALYFNTTGSQNTGIGYSALGGNTTGINNVAVGYIAGNLINSGTDNITSSNSVYLGHDTRASASGNTNEIVIGHEGRGNGSNTVTIGNSSITSNFLNRKINLKGANSAVSSIEYANPAGTLHWTLQTGFGSVGEHGSFSIRNSVLGQDAIVVQPSSNNVTINGAIATITGSLSGTGASFSSDVQTSTRFIAAKPAGEIRITPDLSGTTNRIESFGSLPFSLTSVGAITLAAGGTTPQITLATTGAVTLTGALNGTSASFSVDDLNTLLVTNPTTTGATTGSGLGFRAFNGTSVTQSAGIILTSSTWSFGTYLANQLSIGSDGTGGLALRSANSAPIRFYTGGTTAGLSTQRLEISSTGAATFSSSVSVGAPVVGRLGVRGTTNDSSAFAFEAANSSGSTLFATRNDGMSFFSGNVGIGTLSPNVLGFSKALTISSSNSGIELTSADNIVQGSFSGSTNGLAISGVGENGIRFLSSSSGSATERMRVTSGGYLKASNTGTYLGTTSAFHELRSNNSNSYSLVVQHSASSNPYGLGIFFTASSPNSTNFEFIYCEDTTQSKFIVWSNGSVINRTGSYGTISDIKFKENVVDATPKLDDILKLKVRNFNLIGEEQKQIGFIAQEFEEVFPSMVDVSIDKETEEEYKSIKTSVLIPMLVKAIQEQQEQINQLKNQINQL